MSVCEVPGQKQRTVCFSFQTPARAHERPEDSLGYFYFNVDIMVSEAVAADASDPLSIQADSLVRLDSCRNLKMRTTRNFKQSSGTSWTERVRPWGKRTDKFSDS